MTSGYLTKCLFGDFINESKEAALRHVEEVHRLSPNLAAGYVVPVAALEDRPVD